MIEFRMFGTLQLTDAAGHEVKSLITRPRRLALLAYLAASSGRELHRRDTLLALFWPELDQEHARAALRQALHVLRTALGADVVVTRGDDDIGLDSALLWTDVAAFDRAAAEQHCTAALELYRGPLLDGFFISGAVEFERWLDDERSRRRHQSPDRGHSSQRHGCHRAAGGLSSQQCAAADLARLGWCGGTCDARAGPWGPALAASHDTGQPLGSRIAHRELLRRLTAVLVRGRDDRSADHGSRAHSRVARALARRGRGVETRRDFPPRDRGRAACGRISRGWGAALRRPGPGRSPPRGRGVRISAVGGPDRSAARQSLRDRGQRHAARRGGAPRAADRGGGAPARYRSHRESRSIRSLPAWEDSHSA